LNIFEYLGAPEEEDFKAMRADVVKLPRRVTRKSIEARLRVQAVRNSPALLKLLEDIFKYSPRKRISAWEAMTSEVFDPLRDCKTLPNNHPAPNLYDFTPHELADMPASVRQRLLSSPIVTATSVSQSS